MYIYICVCINAYICIDVYIYKCIYIYIYISICTCIYSCRYIDMAGSAPQTPGQPRAMVINHLYNPQNTPRQRFRMLQLKLDSSYLASIYGRLKFILILILILINAVESKHTLLFPPAMRSTITQKIGSCMTTHWA